MSIAAQAGVVGTLAALLVALLVAPPGTKRLWVGVVVLIALGSAGITYSMMVISVGRLDPRALMPYFFGFWALSFCVLVATRIRYWLRLDRMAEK
jgi:tellurite resistance protein TehA-like permease